MGGVRLGWDKLRKLLEQANTWSGAQSFSDVDVSGDLTVGDTTRVTMGGAANDSGIVFGSLGTATRMIDGSSSGLSGSSDYWAYLSSTNYWSADGSIRCSGNLSIGEAKQLQIASTVIGYTSTGGLYLADGKYYAVGSGVDSRIYWETADSNANVMAIALPNGGATNIPVLIVGDQGILSNDLGWFDGQTIPRLAMVAADEGGYFAHGVDNSDILDIKATTSPVVETDETKFSHKLQVVINGATYYVMLTQS